MNSRRLAALWMLFGVAPVLCFATPRPNIVLIMADDMGFSDIGCYGGEIGTPNLDHLAANGLRFTHFYNGARCCPTRAALLTGLNPHQAGVGDMIKDLGTPAYQGYLNNRCVTIAEVLRQAGYITLMAGKWHVGEDRPHWPVDRGFDRYFGLISGACNYFRREKERTMALDGQPYEPPTNGFYMTDAFTDHAVGFLHDTAGAGRPFFLYLAYTAPHWPLHAPPPEIAKYRGRYRQGWDQLRGTRHARQIELGIANASWGVSPREPTSPDWASLWNEERDEWDLRMAVYAAQIDRMDQGIGRVLRALRDIGVWDNTLIFFLADNGGCHEKVARGTAGASTGTADSFNSYGIHWANASNTPFRMYKHWVHEGGIATPLIVHWPAGLKRSGAITHDVGHVIDLMPTCIEAAGAAYPKTFNGHPILPLQGRSLLRAFQGRRLPERVLFWEHEGNRAVRQGRWKLVSKFPGQWELYDLETDRTEQHNLAARDKKRVQRLAQLYEEWAARCGVVPWGELRKRRMAGVQPK